MSEVTGPNDEFIAFWNEVMVPKFELFRDILTAGMSRHGEAALRGLEVPPGASALDVGCGWGDTAMALARQVGPSGRVTGIDCCQAFLAEGRRQAEAAGLGNLRFVAGDAEVYPFEPEFDLCFSRFGTMFFSNPVAAMRNLRRALKPGGRLMVVTWRGIEDNPFLAVPKQVVLDFLPPPGEDAETCGPGPFSMASPPLVSEQLGAAGYEDVAFERVDVPVTVGRTAEEAMRFQLALGPAGEIFREAGDDAERRRGEIEDALRAELGRYESPGGITMASSSWTITARNPSR